MKRDANVPYLFSFLSFASFIGRLSREGFLQAETLRALGRHDEALGRYGSLDGYGPSPLVHVMDLRRAQIYEQMGEPEKAIEHYEQFTEARADCDPGFRSLVEEAERGLARLRLPS